MLYRAELAVPRNYKTHKYTIWAEFNVLNAKLGGTFSNR